MKLLPVQPAHSLGAQPQDNRWLVEQLWSEQAVGIIGGEPKSNKSLLALHLAVSVASGTPCLRRFGVPRPGRVLLFQAEDALHVVRERLDRISSAYDLALSNLDIQVITTPWLRLDFNDDIDRLIHTVASLRPKLLILDPFVRLHSRNENSSADIAGMLQYLRFLQREYQLAVAVVHHAKKGAAHVRAGQALRGSSEFHAWSDSALYLRRRGQQLTVCAEHRAAPPLDALDLRLVADEHSLALELVAPDAKPDAPPAQLSPDERVRAALAAASSPMRLGELRGVCRLRKSTLCDILAKLTRTGDIHRGPHGYSLSEAPHTPNSAALAPRNRREPVPGTPTLPFDTAVSSTTT